MAYCPTCGTEIDQQAEFCSGCGNELDTTETTVEDTEYRRPDEDGIDWKHAVKVGCIALIPTLILALVLPGGAGGIGFLAGFPLFTYLGYQRPTIKTAFGRLSFWTAILLFMSPLFMILHTFIFAGTQAEGGAETAGAAIGGTILVIGAFVIGIPVGIGFYLLSNRYDIDD